MSEQNMELLIREVLETAKKAQDKRLSFFSDLFIKVRRGNKESVDALRAIEKNYQAELVLEKESFVSLKNAVEEIEKDLALSLDNFNKSFNIDAETEKLQNNKEKGMLPKTQIFRKETHDVTFKLDRLLKEEKETLKVKQEEFDELENSYKTKLQELDKRLRFEVNKIKSTTLSQYDELQKSLLDNNNRKEIKQINKKIEEIRKVGIKSEKELRSSLLKEIQAVEIEFAKVRKDALIEINNVKTDFNIKKQELENERKIVNLNYQIESDKYDFGSRRAINNLKQKMLAKKNAVIVSQNEKVKNVSLEYQKEQNVKINYKKSVSNDFVNVMNSNYNAFSETVNLGTVLINNTYFEQVDAYKAYLEKLIDHALSLFVVLHDEYVNNVISNEYETLKLFINAKYNYEALCHRSYNEDCDKLEGLYNKFVEEMKNNSIAYNQRVEDLFNNLKNNLETLVNNLKNIWNETNAVQKYHNDIKNELAALINRTNDHLNASYENEHNSFAYVDEQVKKYNDAVSNCDRDNQDMANEHKNTEEVIESDMAKYHEDKEQERANIMSELKANIEAIKEECKQVNEAYVLEMNQSLENINIKKINETKSIEEDYKTQMNLLK